MNSNNTIFDVRSYNVTSFSGMGSNDTSFNKTSFNNLTNRKQTVVIGGKKSEYITNTIGVGQGTILGPSLFKRYILDMSKAISGLTIQFADYTIIIITADTLDELQTKASNDMTNIKSWLDANGLTLNADKSRTMTFGNYDTDINVNGEP